MNVALNLACIWASQCLTLLTTTLQNPCTDILLFPAVHLQNIIQSLSEGFDWTGRELKCNHNRLYSSWA